MMMSQLWINGPKKCWPRKTVGFGSQTDLDLNSSSAT